MVAGGIVLAVVLAVRGDDSDDGVAGPDTTTTTEAPLSDEAQELVDLLAESRELDLHLVFEPTEPGSGGATLVVDVWWKGERAAQQITVTAGGQTERAIAYVLPDGNVLCQRPPDEAWACQESVSVATEAGEPAGIIDALASDLGGKDVSVEEAQVGEHEARCFTIEGETGGAVCVTDEGIPVRFTLGDSQMVLASVERSVGDEVFEPPAEVSEPPTTSTTAS